MIINRALLGFVALALPLAQLAQAQTGRDYISIVGSSTVYPFTTTVAEQFGKTGKFKTPKVESTGTGGGIKLFCGGVGTQHPDIVNSSRPIKASEVDLCRKAGVKDILEVPIGYDGIVFANTKKGPVIKVTRRDLYLALAKSVPSSDNTQKLVPNPYKTWNQVNKALPADRIEVLGPPPTSGTRDAFVELVMQAGCSSFEWIKALQTADEARFKAACDTVREDGAYIEAGENDNLIVQKLVANPKLLGIFGYSFMEENAAQVQGALVDGVAPTFDNISSGKYSVSRPLFVYVKKSHIGVIPGINEFLNEYVSARAMGEEGYLAAKGLVPLHPAEFAKVRKTVAGK